MKKNYPTKTQLFCIVLASFALLSSVPYLMGPGLNNPQPIGKFLNGKFPANTPAPTPYRVAFPNLTFNSPLTFLPLPDGNRIVVGQRDGKIYWFDNDESTQQKTLLVDLSAEVGVVWDGGFLGLTAHPEFGNGKNYFYMYYSSEDSQSRDFPNYYTTQSCNSEEYWGNFLFLKRIEVNPTTLNVVPGSLSTMLKVRMYGTTHRGGGLLFGNDGFLYLTTGDQTAFRKSQDIFNNLDGGVLRIDVDQDPSKSHPPVRTMPEDHGYADELTGRGYYIPNDNPFLSPGGQRFEEYYTLGHRNPHRMSKDKVTGTMYIGEIGGGRHEEINVVKKGKNFGWPLYEGYASGPGCGLSMYNNMAHEGPLLAFPRSQANAIIGGFVYRGSENPDLYGKYICADYGSGEEIWKVDTTTGAYELITNFTPNNIISFGEDLDGELYLLKQGNNTPLYKMTPGLQNGGTVPLLLSETNAFSNLQTLEPSNGLLPYELIEPFWSDGAKKKRWMAIPNDGTHDTAAERIVFSENDVWQFPSGTVLVKHFELPIDERDPSLVRRLETRFSVKGNDGNFYFLTYKWNDEGTDAVLLTSGIDEELSVITASGSSQTVTWTYPDKGDCVSCHNNVSQGTLGLRTRYLNSDYTYPTTGNTGNQLVTLSHLGILDQNISDADTQGYLTYKAMNNSSASLDEKARSYLDLNCAYCHRSGTGNRAQFDLRMLKSLDETRLLTVGTLQPLGISGEAIVKAGDASKSILYHRMNSTDAIAMPPIAKNRVDVQSVALIEQWINELDTNPTVNLAWNKPAVQSTTAYEGVASRAVDGNRSGVYNNGSVTHTATSNNPWWRVDLGDTYALSEIKIYNRTDCCTTRLQDAKVYVGNTESNDPNAYTEIGTLGSNYEQIFSGLDVTGRYVMVYLPGSSKILSLAEVEVYGALNPVVPVTGVVVSPTDVTLIEGDTQQLVATVSPSNATNTAINWSSNDTDIATVDANGEVTAVSVGQAMITATTDDGGFTAQTHISITDATGCGSPTGPPSATVSVDNAACGTTTGGLTFSFVDHPDRTHIEFSTDGGQTYPTYVQDNSGSTSVASLVLGDYNVWVRWGNNDCPLELGNFTIAEDCVPVTGVTVSPTNTTLTEGGTQQLTATVAPSDASNSGVSWSSSDTSVATVDAQGLVTAVSGGSATITVTTDEGGFTATSAITVESSLGDNLALNRPAVQSTTHLGGTADRAVDGNRSGVFNDNSVTHSQLTDNPWWQVDLGAEYDIDQIDVYNRTDACCSTRLAGARIYVARTSGTDWTEHTFVKKLNNDAVQSATDVGQRGRYILIVLHGQDEYLNLAEVEVYGRAAPTVPVTGITVSPATLSMGVGGWGQLTAVVSPSDATNREVEWSSSDTSVATVDGSGRVTGVSPGSTVITARTADGGFTASSTAEVEGPSGNDNLALNRPTVQSSTHLGGTSDRAVDGNRSGIYANGSITHSQLTDDPWWRVDLGDIYDIDRIDVYNRTDACCRTRLAGARIYVGALESSDPSDYAFVKKLGNDAVQSATGVGLSGRYVLIVLHGQDEYLNLAEVEVYGSSVSGTSPQRARIAVLGELATDDIIVSPNPSNGLFEVYLGGLMGRALQLSVYDGTGRQVHGSFLSEGHWYYHDMDLVHLPSGTYTLVVATLDGETHTKQVVIR